MAGGGADDVNLEYTPTWIIALLCFVIVAISLSVERFLHFVGKYLLRKKQKPLFEALLKIKEELMLLGFISLLLTVCQERIIAICVPKHLVNHWLPCKKENEEKHSSTTTPAHFFTSFLPGGRRLLSGSSTEAQACEDKGKAQMLSLTALHHLHIFIFGLAVSHVVFSALTILFGGAKIRQWKQWEDSAQKKKYHSETSNVKLTHVREHDFIKDRFLGFGKCETLLAWLVSFFKQFYGSVTESDYATLRHGFVMMHSRGNMKFNFHKYIVRALEADFKKVVGISWYLWVFVVIFLLLNVYGWHAYFWIAFVPFILLLAVGTKLENVITQLAREVAQRHIAVAGELVVNPSDEHFWLRRPQLVLVLIHMTLFQNSFEIAFFVWIWAQYGFNSCIMGEVAFIIPRLVVGVIVQFVCSYSTLPLYAIVTLMGSKVKKAIFEEPIQVSLDNWIEQAKKNRAAKKAGNGSTTQVGPRESLVEESIKEAAMEEGKAGEIEAATLSKT